MSTAHTPEDRLDSVAHRIARETMKVWETCAQKGQIALVEPHQESFSVLARVGLGPGEKTVPERLLSLLDDGNLHASKHAATAISELEGPESAILNAFLRRLEDEDSAQRRAIFTNSLGLLEEGRDSSVIEALLRRLEDDEEIVRMTAAQALGELGVSDASVLETLERKLDDQSVGVSYEAYRTLCRVGATEPNILESLLGRLEGDEHPTVQEYAAEVIVQIGSSDVLINRVRNNDYSRWQQEKVISALGEISSPDPDVIDFLVNRLEDSEARSVRREAARALGQVGCSDPAVIEALLDKIEEEQDLWNLGLRREAAEALGKLNVADPETLELLFDLLDQGNEKVRKEAAVVLGKLGISDSDVLEVLLSLLNASDATTRLRAVEALGEIGASDSEITEALLTRLNDDYERVRRAASEALGKLGDSDRAIVEGLLEQLHAEALLTRSAALNALRNIGLSTPSVVEGLLEKMDEATPPVTNEIADVVRTMPWRVFSKAQTGKALQERFIEVSQDKPMDRDIARADDEEHLIIHWQALARLLE